MKLLLQFNFLSFEMKIKAYGKKNRAYKSYTEKAN